MTNRYVFNVRGVLVNLNGLGMFYPIAYSAGYVFGRLNCEGASRLICVGLDTGLVHTEVPSEWAELFSDSREADILRLRKILGTDCDFTLVEDLLVTRIILAFLTHRVSGDKIIQGLKLDKIELGYKITENYLGGWHVSQIGEDGETSSYVLVDDIIMDVYTVLEGREG